MKLYVGNLPFGITDSDLRDLFAPFGEPDSAQVIFDRVSGMSKGFGFVEFADAGKAKAALAGLNGKEVKGRVLKVNEAKPRNESAGGRGRGRY